MSDKKAPFCGGYYSTSIHQYLVHYRGKVHVFSSFEKGKKQSNQLGIISNNEYSSTTEILVTNVLQVPFYLQLTCN